MTDFERWWDVQDYPNTTKEIAKAAWNYAMFSASETLIKAAMLAMRETYSDKT